ncbi:MAG TPA: hypothetical protein VG963_19740, partial [Polyangiaceae bacterium]|nr:hypothetical protein [Polyangiaceae bacterium]
MVLRASAVVLAGCTLQNSTKEFPGGSAPANMFSLQPSERSLELWQNPGDDLLAALTEIEANDKTTVLPQYNRVLGEVLAEAGQYFAALTAFQPFGTAF